MSVKVTKEVTTDTGFSHKEETIYSDHVTPAELAVITALEVGDAANRTAMADLAVKRLQSTEQA